MAEGNGGKHESEGIKSFDLKSRKEVLRNLKACKAVLASKELEAMTVFCHTHRFDYTGPSIALGDLDHSIAMLESNILLEERGSLDS